LSAQLPSLALVSYRGFTQPKRKVWITALSGFAPCGPGELFVSISISEHVHALEIT